KPKEPWVIHDLRRTAASGMARLGVRLPVIEKVLNHVSGSFRGIVGVYQRHEYAAEKRHALQTWANHIEALVNGKADDKIVQLTRRGWACGRTFHTSRRRTLAASPTRNTSPTCFWSDIATSTRRVASSGYDI